MVDKELFFDVLADLDHNIEELIEILDDAKTNQLFCVAQIRPHVIEYVEAIFDKRVSDIQNKNGILQRFEDLLKGR